MSILIRILAIVLLLFASTRVLAVDVPSIYQVDVPIISHAADVRSTAIKNALEQVLIKVSGNSHIIDTNPKLKAKLAEAEDLVQEFSYTTPAQPTPAQPYTLVVHFDPEGVNKLLQESGSSEWGQNRPMLIVWLAYEGQDHTNEIVSNSENPVQSVFVQAAQKRGLPVIFPLMDVNEMIQITATDVMNKNLTVLKPASQRYAGNAILVGHLAQSGTGFVSEWQLTMGNDHWDFKEIGKSMSDVFTQLTNDISDTLAKRFAAVVSAEVQSKVTLNVMGLKQQTDLAQLMKYLQQLTAVVDVQLQSVDGDKAVLTVNLHGSQAAFAQEVSLGSNLQPVGDNNKTTGSATQPTTMQYQWTQ